jgi:DNA-binding protein H-NS
MKSADLKSMSVDQLWELHEQVVAELGQKIAAEKARLEERLSKLHAAPAARVSASSGGEKLKAGRRPYPKVVPKYRNPNNPAETWAGRGKQPRWVRAQLRSGKKLDDLRIERA